MTLHFAHSVVQVRGNRGGGEEPPEGPSGPAARRGVPFPSGRAEAYHRQAPARENHAGVLSRAGAFVFGSAAIVLQVGCAR